MKWNRTSKGVENDRFAIERKIDKNIFTGRDMKPDYILIDKATGERSSFGTMKDAKFFAEWI